MGIINWVLIGSIAVIIVTVFLVEVVRLAKDGKNKKSKPETVNEEQAQPANEKPQQTERPNIEVSIEKQDIVISAQQTIIASKNGTLKPGKYSILSGDSGVDSFNVRIGKFVKEYKHGDVVVIADGEEVTPTSHKIILR